MLVLVAETSLQFARHFVHHAEATCSLRDTLCTMQKPSCNLRDALCTMQKPSCSLREALCTVQKPSCSLLLVILITLHSFLYKSPFTSFRKLTIFSLDAPSLVNRLTKALPIIAPSAFSQAFEKVS